MPKLTPTALKAKIKLLQQQLDKAEASKRPAILRVRALMQKLGVSLQDLRDHEGESARGKRSTKKNARSANAGRKVAVKYRDEAGNQWSGRGRTPTWLATAEAAGRRRDEFLVQP